MSLRRRASKLFDVTPAMEDQGVAVMAFELVDPADHDQVIAAGQLRLAGAIEPGQAADKAGDAVDAVGVLTGSSHR